MSVVDKLNKYKKGVELSCNKLSIADPDGDIIFLRKYKSRSGEILELLNKALFVLEEDDDGKQGN